MMCPVCKNIGLEPATLEKELPASICPKCGGTWISFGQYWTWLEKHGPHLAEKSSAGPCSPVQDSKGVKICSECGGILLKYHVGHELPFAIEQCGKCKGIWLDKSEWDVLKAKNLHDEIHLILQTDWQKAIRREEYEHTVEQTYKNRFGPEIYAEIKRIREWLARQPERQALLAYLTESEHKTSI